MAFRSRWGWHPCDYATFVLLKGLHEAYWRALRQYAAWQRWRRKLPRNRVLRRRIRDERGYKVGTEVVGPWPEPPLPPVFCTRRQVLTHWSEEGKPLKRGRLKEEVIFDDLGIPEAYRAARRPAASESEVLPLRLTAEELRRFASEIEKARR
jgi:hypothetical protein